MMVDGEYRIEANGIAHWVRVAGAQHAGAQHAGAQHASAPLVLVHGGPGASAYAWEAIGDRLAEKMPVVFYDQRGCGRSDRPSSEVTYTMGQLVADLEALRAALGIDRMVPWGVSYGSVIAAEYAVAHPERVQCLILQAPPIVGPLHPGVWTLRPSSVDAVATPETRTSLRTALGEITDPIGRLWQSFKVLEADPDTRTRFMFHDPAKAAAAAVATAEAPNYGFNEQMAEALIGAERPELFDDLADTGLSTLVMIGLWDLNAGVDAARNLALRLPQGSLHLFLHSAHLPHEEEPDEYLAAVHAFTGGSPSTPPRSATAAPNPG